MFLDDIQNEAKQYGGGSNSDFFQFKKGVNKMRILAQPKVLATHFFGKGHPAVVCVGMDEGCKHHEEGADKPSIKLATYILDREDGKVKIAELPLSISYSINDLQQDEDFAFEEFPMPYDVKVTHDPDNPDPKAKYRVVGSPKREKLSESEDADYEAQMSKMTPEDYVEKRKEKQKNKVPVDIRDTSDYPVNDGDEPPF